MEREKEKGKDRWTWVGEGIGMGRRKEKWKEGITRLEEMTGGLVLEKRSGKGGDEKRERKYRELKAEDR
jgi:hypothetical protein